MNIRHPRKLKKIKSWWPFRANLAYFLGNIHVLRKQKGGREGVSQMLTIAYVGGGGAKGSCLRNYILEFFFALDRKITKKSSKKC